MNIQVFMIMQLNICQIIKRTQMILICTHFLASANNTSEKQGAKNLQAVKKQHKTAASSSRLLVH